MLTVFDSATQAAKRTTLVLARQAKLVVLAAGVAETNTVKHKLVNTNPNTPNIVFDQTKILNCPMIATSVDTKNTQHTLLTIALTLAVAEV